MDKKVILRELRAEVESMQQAMVSILSKIELYEGMLAADEAVQQATVLQLKQQIAALKALGKAQTTPAVAMPQAEPIATPVVEIPAPVVEEEKVVEPAPAVEEKMVEPAPVAQNAPVQVEIAVKAPQVEVTPAPVQEAVKAEAPAPVETPRSENKDARLITDLRKAIGLNDRFRLKHDLFDNNEALLFNTIDALNSMETFAQADAYLKSNFNWNADDATVVYFYDMLQRKFV